MILNQHSMTDPDAVARVANTVRNKNSKNLLRDDRHDGVLRPDSFASSDGPLPQLVSSGHGDRLVTSAPRGTPRGPDGAPDAIFRSTMEVLLSNGGGRRSAYGASSSKLAGTQDPSVEPSSTSATKNRSIVGPSSARAGGGGRHSGGSIATPTGQMISAVASTPTMSVHVDRDNQLLQSWVQNKIRHMPEQKKRQLSMLHDHDEQSSGAGAIVARRTEEVAEQQLDGGALSLFSDAVLSVSAHFFDSAMHTPATKSNGVTGKFPASAGSRQAHETAVERLRSRTETKIPRQYWIAHDPLSSLPGGGGASTSHDGHAQSVGNMLDQLASRKKIAFPSTNPSSRPEVYFLAQALDQMLADTKALSSVVDPTIAYKIVPNELSHENEASATASLSDYSAGVRKVWSVLDAGLTELARQLATTCSERAALLDVHRTVIADLLSSSTLVALHCKSRAFDEAKKRIDDEDVIISKNRQIINLRNRVVELENQIYESEKFGELWKEKAELYDLGVAKSGFIREFQKREGERAQAVADAQETEEVISKVAMAAASAVDDVMSERGATAAESTAQRMLREQREKEALDTAKVYEQSLHLMESLRRAVENADMLCGPFYDKMLFGTPQLNASIAKGRWAAVATAIGEKEAMLDKHEKIMKAYRSWVEHRNAQYAPNDPLRETAQCDYIFLQKLGVPGVSADEVNKMLDPAYNMEASTKPKNRLPERWGLSYDGVAQMLQDTHSTLDEIVSRIKALGQSQVLKEALRPSMSPPTHPDMPCPLCFRKDQNEVFRRRSDTHYKGLIRDAKKRDDELVVRIATVERERDYLQEVLNMKDSQLNELQERISATTFRRNTSAIAEAGHHHSHPGDDDRDSVDSMEELHRLNESSSSPAAAAPPHPPTLSRPDSSRRRSTQSIRIDASPADGSEASAELINRVKSLRRATAAPDASSESPSVERHLSATMIQAEPATEPAPSGDGVNVPADPIVLNIVINCTCCAGGTKQPSVPTIGISGELAPLNWASKKDSLNGESVHEILTSYKFGVDRRDGDAALLDDPWEAKIDDLDTLRRTIGVALPVAQDKVLSPEQQKANAALARAANPTFWTKMEESIAKHAASAEVRELVVTIGDDRPLMQRIAFDVAMRAMPHVEAKVRLIESTETLAAATEDVDSGPKKKKKGGQPLDAVIAPPDSERDAHDAQQPLTQQKIMENVTSALNKILQSPLGKGLDERKAKGGKGAGPSGSSAGANLAGPRTATDRSLRWILRAISSFYKHKFMADSITLHEGHTILPAPAFLQAFYRQLLGTTDLVHEAMFSVFYTCKKYAEEDFRVLLFTRFLTEDYSCQVLCFAMTVMRMMDECRDGLDFTDSTHVQFAADDEEGRLEDVSLRKVLSVFEQARVVERPYADALWRLLQTPAFSRSVSAPEFIKAASKADVIDHQAQCRLAHHPTAHELHQPSSRVALRPQSSPPLAEMTVIELAVQQQPTTAANSRSAHPATTKQKIAIRLSQQDSAMCRRVVPKVVVIALLSHFEHTYRVRLSGVTPRPPPYDGTTLRNDSAGLADVKAKVESVRRAESAAPTRQQPVAQK